ncbi:hypothetical protein ACFXTH_034679 [Malus domestica]
MGFSTLHFRSRFLVSDSVIQLRQSSFYLFLAYKHSKNIGSYRSSPVVVGENETRGDDVSEAVRVENEAVQASVQESARKYDFSVWKKTRHGRRHGCFLIWNSLLWHFRRPWLLSCGLGVKRCLRHC